MYYNEKYKLANKFLLKGKYIGNFNALRTQFSEEQIIKYMKALKYSDENFAIMAGDEKYLRETNPALFEKSKFIDKMSDSRTYLQYCMDLVSGWLYEDLLIYSILSQNKELHILRSGEDRFRTVLGHHITNMSDMKVEYKGQIRPCEIAMSHGNFHYKYGKIDLRYDKRKHLIEQNSLLLIVETSAFSKNKNDKLFTLLSPNELLEYKESFAFDKPCQSIELNPSKFKNTSYIAETLISYITTTN